MELTKDGKATVSTIRSKDEVIVQTGTYQMDGDKITVVLTADGKETKELWEIKSFKGKTLEIDGFRGIKNDPYTFKKR